MDLRINRPLLIARFFKNRNLHGNVFIGNQVANAIAGNCLVINALWYLLGKGCETKQTD